MYGFGGHGLLRLPHDFIDGICAGCCRQGGSLAHKSSLALLFLQAGRAYCIFLVVTDVRLRCVKAGDEARLPMKMRFRKENKGRIKCLVMRGLQKGVRGVEAVRERKGGRPTTDSYPLVRRKEGVVGR